MRKFIRQILIVLGLWPALRKPLHLIQGAVLVLLTKARLYDPSLFHPHAGNSLAMLHKLEIQAEFTASPIELLSLLDPLVNNASVLAEQNIARMRKHKIPKDVSLHLDRLDLRLTTIRSLPSLASTLTNSSLLNEFYHPDGFQLIPYPSSRKLVVIFTTLHNNFGVSNVVIHAMLRKFGASVLLLKDPTVCCYGRGVVGLGNNPEQLGHAVTQLAGAIGCDELYVMGFSSSGYSSLFFTSLVKCDGYLGFSINTANELQSETLQKLRTFNWAQHYWLKKNVSSQFLINLRSKFEKPTDTIERMLIVGDCNSLDMAQALNLEHCPNFRILILENCGHNTVSVAFERGQMDALLSRLLRC